MYDENFCVKISSKFRNLRPIITLENFNTRADPERGDWAVAPPLLRDLRKQIQKLNICISSTVIFDDYIFFMNLCKGHQKIT